MMSGLSPEPQHLGANVSGKRYLKRFGPGSFPIGTRVNGLPTLKTTGSKHPVNHDRDALTFLEAKSVEMAPASRYSLSKEQTPTGAEFQGAGS